MEIENLKTMIEEIQQKRLKSDEARVHHNYLFLTSLEYTNFR